MIASFVFARASLVDNMGACQATASVGQPPDMGQVQPSGSFVKGSFVKGVFSERAFSRDSREFRDSRDCREPKECGKERRIRPFSREPRDFRESRDSRDLSSEKNPFVMTPKLFPFHETTMLRVKWDTDREVPSGFSYRCSSQV